MSTLYRAFCQPLEPYVTPWGYVLCSIAFGLLAFLIIRRVYNRGEGTDVEADVVAAVMAVIFGCAWPQTLILLGLVVGIALGLFVTCLPMLGWDLLRGAVLPYLTRKARVRHAAREVRAARKAYGIPKMWLRRRRL